MKIREVRAALNALLKQTAPGVPVSKSDTADEERVTAAIKSAVADYLASTVFAQSYVSYGQIAAAILSAEGVVDFEGLAVGGGTSNIAVGERECPVLGEVTITYG